MPIRGLTAREQSDDISSLGRVEISVFKGKRKGNSIGTDLGQYLRIATNNRMAQLMLKQSGSYGTPDENGDFITDRLNIYLAYDDPEKTFQTNMKAYDASGLKVVCDRHTICKKRVETSDTKGNIFRPIKDVSEQCPLRNSDSLAEKCPNDCNKEGNFYFYIKELLDKDMMLPCVLTTHSFQDLTYLTDTLFMWKETIGSIELSPFPAMQYRHHIPFVLTRTEVKIKRPVVSGGLRTGKKADGKHFALSLQVDPIFMELHRKWRMMQELESRNMVVSSATVMGLLSGNAETIIDVESVVIEQPKQLPPPKKDISAWINKLRSYCDRFAELSGTPYNLPPDIEEFDEDQIISLGRSLRTEIDKLEQQQLQIQETLTQQQPIIAEEGVENSEPPTLLTW